MGSERRGTPDAQDGLPGKGPKVDRRGFLTAVGVAGAALAGTIGDGCDVSRPEPEFLPAEARAWWRDGGRYFVQHTVDASRHLQGVIRAKVDGHWQEFHTVELPSSYVRWSFEERRARLDKIAQGIFSTRDLAGPHNACVATYGGHPRMGRISLNTAYKGMGWIPKPENLEPLLAQLAEASDLPEPRSREEFLAQMRSKAAFLEGLYRDPELFDMRKQGSLELFTFGGYFTHTFLNMMANPVASASFLAYPTFELRAITQLLHPEDPGLSRYERGLVQYLNKIHDFIHSGNGPKIACIYHIIEAYEDTPVAGAKGRKLV